MKSFFSIIVLNLFLLANSFASENSELTGQLKIFNQISPKVDCLTCSSKQPLSHQKASILSDINQKPLELTVISIEEANGLVSEFLDNKNIPFDYALDGCFARAHKMAFLLEENGILSGKAFVIGRLFASTKYGPASWRYHVAPVVLVNINGELKPFIIDPALFPRAVPYEEWRNTITGSLNPGRARFRGMEYYTKRFIYDPTNSKADLLEFQSSDLVDTDATLGRLMEIKKQLDARP